MKKEIASPITVDAEFTGYEWSWPERVVVNLHLRYKAKNPCPEGRWTIVRLKPPSREELGMPNSAAVCMSLNLGTEDLVRIQDEHGKDYSFQRGEDRVILNVWMDPQQTVTFDVVTNVSFTTLMG